MTRRTTLLLWAMLPMSYIGIWLSWPFVRAGSAPRDLDGITMAIWERPFGRACYLSNLARQARVMKQGRLLNWCLGVNGARSFGKASAPLVDGDLVSMEQDNEVTKALALAVGRDVDPSQYGVSHFAWALPRIGYWDMATVERNVDRQFFFTKKYLGWIARLDEESRIKVVMAPDIDAMAAIVSDVTGDSVFDGIVFDAYDVIYDLKENVVSMLMAVLAHAGDRKAVLKQWCDRYRRSVAMHWLAVHLINRSSQYFPAHSAGTTERFRKLNPTAADWDLLEKSVIEQIDQILLDEPGVLTPSLGGHAL